MIQIGRYEIRSVVNGWIRLDGGAMFGVVPKVLWEESADVDDQNRILLATRSLIAINRQDRRTIVVDTGCGSKWAATKAERYGIRFEPDALVRALAESGLITGDVTDVVVSHLHFDHNGGLTRWYDEPGERTELSFPNAAHWIHRRHWEHAQSPHIKDRASFLREDWSGLAKAGVLRLLEGDNPESTIPGVRWVVSNGHTPFQIHPYFEGGGGGGSLLFTGDIIPMIAHLRQAWVMAYDMLPMTTIEEKGRFSSAAIRDRTWLAFPHDPRFGAVRIDGRPERPIVSETLEA